MSGCDSPVRKLRATGCTCLKPKNPPVGFSVHDHSSLNHLIVKSSHRTDIRVRRYDIPDTKKSIPSMSAVPAAEIEGTFVGKVKTSLPLDTWLTSQVRHATAVYPLRKNRGGVSPGLNGALESILAIDAPDFRCAE
jgi:hypothetical protein